MQSMSQCTHWFTTKAIIFDRYNTYETLNRLIFWKNELISDESRRSKASAVNKARRDVGDLVGYDQVPDAVRAQMDAALVAAIEPY